MAVRRPENLIPPARQKEVGSQLLVFSLREVELEKKWAAYMDERRKVFGVLRDLEGEAMRFKGRAVLLEFREGGVHSQPAPLAVPADYYTVGKIFAGGDYDYKEPKLQLIWLHPVVELDITGYGTIIDKSLQAVSLAKVNATNRLREAAAQQV